MNFIKKFIDGIVLPGGEWPEDVHLIAETRQFADFSKILNKPKL